MMMQCAFFPKSAFVATVGAMLWIGSGASSPSQAQSSNSIFTADQEACFGRVYDRAHLATHPQQKATGFHIYRWLGRRQQAENWYPGERDEGIRLFREDGRLNVEAYVAFRDRRGTFYNGLSCTADSKGVLQCAVDCDGGSFTLKRENANAVLLNNNGFVVVGGCGEEIEKEKEIYFKPGLDDKVFRLETKPLAACIAEKQKIDPIPAGTPLRERFKEDEAFCFGQDYDATHLGANPRQQVASLRVGRLDPASEREDKDKAEAPGNLWWFNVKLAVSLKLKTGRQVAATYYNCYPEEGSWNCSREATSDKPSACIDRSIQVARGPGGEIIVQNRNSGLPITNECETAPTGQQYPTKPLTRSDDKVFRLTRMPIEACKAQ